MRRLILKQILTVALIGLLASCSTIESRYEAYLPKCRAAGMNQQECNQMFLEIEQERRQRGAVWAAGLQSYSKSMQDNRPVNCTTNKIGNTLYTNCY